MKNAIYSHRSFMGQDLTSHKASDLSNSEIVGSCFAQELSELDPADKKSIFPVGMTGVTFINCNLDNVLVPVGNVVQGGSNRLIKAQNDLEDWVLDETLKTPTEPANVKTFLREGKSISATSIPKTKSIGVL